MPRVPPVMAATLPLSSFPIVPPILRSHLNLSWIRGFTDLEGHRVGLVRVIRPLSASRRQHGRRRSHPDEIFLHAFQVLLGIHTDRVIRSLEHLDRNAV